MTNSISLTSKVLLGLILAFPCSVWAIDPSLGSHVLVYQRYSDSTPVMTSSEIVTREAASTIIISVGRGKIAGNSIPPVDNKGNNYLQIGTSHKYTNWPNSGTALYANTSVLGGIGHTFTVKTNDEVTLMAVEVTNGKEIVDYKWNEVLKGSPLTSLSVKTSGPATLIAYWWGDNGSGPHTVQVNNGFVVRDSLLLSGSLVQAAVATKEVSEAGTYDVSWSATPLQGAQLWLVAVQNTSDILPPKSPENLRTLN